MLGCCLRRHYAATETAFQASQGSYREEYEFGKDGVNRTQQDDPSQARAGEQNEKATGVTARLKTGVGLTCCVTLGKLLNLSEFHSLHL